MIGILLLPLLILLFVALGRDWKRPLPAPVFITVEANPDGEGGESR